MFACWDTLLDSPLDPDQFHGFGTLNFSTKELVDLLDVSFSKKNFGIFISKNFNHFLAVSCALNWTSTFLVGKFFPPLQNAMGAYVFIIFAGVAAFVTVFLIKFAPETKGKSFEEIEAEFEKMNGVKNEEATPMKSDE